MFFVMKTFKIYSFSNFQLQNAVLTHINKCLILFGKISTLQLKENRLSTTNKNKLETDLHLKEEQLLVLKMNNEKINNLHEQKFFHTQQKYKNFYSKNISPKCSQIWSVDT